MIILYAQRDIDYKVSGFCRKSLTNTKVFNLTKNKYDSKELYHTQILKILKIVSFADYEVMLLYMLPQYGMQRYV